MAMGSGSARVEADEHVRDLSTSCTYLFRPDLRSERHEAASKKPAKKIAYVDVVQLLDVAFMRDGELIWRTAADGIRLLEQARELVFPQLRGATEFGLRMRRSSITASEVSSAICDSDYGNRINRHQHGCPLLKAAV